MSAFPAGRPMSQSGFFTDPWRMFLLGIYNKTGGASGVIYASSITNVPAGHISATDVQAALNQLDLIKGTVNSFTFTDANGITGTVLNPTTTPSLTLALGAITPASVAAAGTVTGSNLSGTNTGDQFTNTTASVLIGRGTASGAGAAQEITLGSGVSMLGTVLSATGLGGSVTSVSVVSTNGFAGTVATASTTPAITLTTTLTGLLKGNGTAMSTAASGTDYSAGTAGLATGIVKTTTGTGALTVAVAADFPTLNQSTTGSAAKWTTARNLAGNSVDGSANVAFANKFIVQGTTDTGLSAAQFLGALGTGIVKNTTTTGVLSIAIAADFPTLNQSTTGTAANVTGIVLGANGGTGVANTGKTITLGGNLTTSGAFASTFTMTNTTTVTFPVTGTLATLAGAEAFTNKTYSGTSVTINTGGASQAGAFISSGLAGATGTVVIQDTGVNGVNLRLGGNGATTPDKYITVLSGVLNFISSGYAAVVTTMTDAGTWLMSGGITSKHPTLGVGYSAGAGGVQTQLTSKSTGVTLDTVTGQITMNAASLGANTTVSFTFTNAAIAATDTLDIHRKSGGTALAYNVWVDSIAAGSAVIAVRNITAGALLEAVVLQFNVQKGSNS